MKSTIKILLSIVLANTAQASVDVAHAPAKKIVHTLPSRIERDLQDHLTLTRDNDRIIYLNEFFKKESPPLQDKELKLLVPILYRFYQLNKFDILKQLIISEDWRKHLLEFQPTLDKIFIAIDSANKKLPIQRMVVTETQEETILPLTIQNDLHPYEIAQRALEFYQKKYASGFPNFDVLKNDILQKFNKFSPFNCTIIYILVMLDHPNANSEKLVKSLPFFSNKRENAIITNIVASSLFSRSAKHVLCSAEPRKFACRKAIEKYKQNKSHIISTLVQQTGLLHDLATIVETYAREYPWGVSLEEIITNTVISDLIFSRSDNRYICLNSLMLNDLRGLHHIAERADADCILDLQSNMIETIDINNIGENIGSIKLSCNMIAAIQGTQPKINLKHLSLMANSLTSIPSNLSFLIPHVQTLVLNHNPITDISTEVDSLKQLKYLSLDEDKLSSQAKEHLKQIKNRINKRSS